MTTTIMSIRTVAVATCLSIALTACAGTDTIDTGPDLPQTSTAPTTTTTTTGTSSTTEAPSTTEPTTGGETSASARAKIEQIASAADSGDLMALAELALSGAVPFTASFGQDFSDPAELVAYWEGIEGPSIPEVILGLFEAGYTETFASYEDGTQVVIHVAPAVMGDGSTAADRDRLEGIFGEETVASWYADGMYLGWRIGIDDDGNWRFLVIGD